MTQHYALFSIVWMIGIVLLFDRIHRRHVNFRRLGTMYQVVAAGRASATGFAA